MKKLLLLITAAVAVLSTYSQVESVLFIDSLSSQANSYKTILLFTEFCDTTDDQTGRVYTQRSSYYFDWRHHELRYIEVYDFDKTVKKHKTERAFRKKRGIPSSTHITYTFFDNKLVKVVITPSARQCNQCSAEYYFSNDILISKKEQNAFELQRNFLSDANFYLARLQIKKGENLLTNKQ